MQKLSITIDGHRTSISLEKEFIDALRAIAKKQNKSISGLVSEIDTNKNKSQISNLKYQINLSSAIRVFVLLNKI